jgi:hypothetical protein
VEGSGKRQDDKGREKRWWWWWRVRVTKTKKEYAAASGVKKLGEKG